MLLVRHVRIVMEDYRMDDLVVIKNELCDEEKYVTILDEIGEMIPEIDRSTKLFNKSQSHFMDNMLTVSHITPIRNLRQILAEVKNTRMALAEAYYSFEKIKLDLEEKKIYLLSLQGIPKRRVELEVKEIEWKLSCLRENVNGAIRKLGNYAKQYRLIQETYNLQNFTEDDFEEEEERYHITKAFQQGLSAARAHGGYIDEGNQIYLEQVGINGTVAQVCVTNYLNQEAIMVGNGVEPTHEMQLEFLLSMAEKFKGCSKKYAQWKGQRM